MLAFLSKIMLGLSIVGIFAILIEKIPVLAELPETSAPTLSDFGARVKSFGPESIGFSPEKFLQRVLSKSKVFVLKIEHQIDHQLRKMRRKNQSPKKDFGNDEYWDKLKEEVDSKKTQDEEDSLEKK